VKEGEARKLVSNYKGIYRVIRTYPNFTCDIADETFRPQRVHFNRLRLVTERMIWQDQECPQYDPTSKVLEHYRKNEQTQTSTLVAEGTVEEIDNMFTKLSVQNQTREKKSSMDSLKIIYPSVVSKKSIQLIPRRYKGIKQTSKNRGENNKKSLKQLLRRNKNKYVPVRPVGRPTKQKSQQHEQPYQNNRKTGLLRSKNEKQSNSSSQINNNLIKPVEITERNTRLRSRITLKPNKRYSDQIYITAIKVLKVLADLGREHTKS